MYVCILTQSSMQLSNCDPSYCNELQFPKHVYLLYIKEKVHVHTYVCMYVCIHVIMYILTCIRTCETTKVLLLGVVAKGASRVATQE